MEELEKILINQIVAFLEGASLTTKLFQQQYGITTSPVKAVKRSKISKGIIPMKGVLQHGNKEIAYQFHGNGCKFIFPEQRIIDFDYQFPEGNYDGRFGLYRIWYFVKETIPEFKNESTLELYLGRLEEKGVIKAVPRPKDFKERLAVGSHKSVNQLEQEGFFEDYDTPKYKGYYLTQAAYTLNNYIQLVDATLEKLHEKLETANSNQESEQQAEMYQEIIATIMEQAKDLEVAIV